MHRTSSVLLPFLTLLVAAAIAAMTRAAEKNQIPEDLRAVLEKGEQFELLSLSPELLKEKPKDAFHGWKVLGKTTLKDAEARQKLVAALQKGAKENVGNVKECFNPRHGIRVTHEGKTTDLVICFECFQVQVYRGEKQGNGFPTTGSPQAAFDGALKEAKVPLPEKPKK
jgi:hypothetical protein